MDSEAPKCILQLLFSKMNIIKYSYQTILPKSYQALKFTNFLPEEEQVKQHYEETIKHAQNRKQFTR